MSFLTDLAMQAYDEDGEVFPIQYTCLGWEAAAVKFAKDPYILSACPTVNCVQHTGELSALPCFAKSKRTRSALSQLIIAHS